MLKNNRQVIKMRLLAGDGNTHPLSISAINRGWNGNAPTTVIVDEGQVIDVLKGVDVARSNRSISDPKTGEMVYHGDE